ncbi:TPA: NACHT domain-containing protein [Klebsiella quasipneumoniae]|nr:NACHT domain-containing protein [Klebsiella quasipneumoniae]UAA12767.1 NACHT domain-containing protein [Klebsiella quasipneumoniae]
MAAKDDVSSLSEKFLEASERVFYSLWNNSQQDLWHWLILVFIFIIGLCFIIYLLIKAIGSAVEQLAKLVEGYKSSGLPIWLNKKNKVRVRRRKQFCAVLDADLAYLAKAENWNDQYFTDLEAEVETEGGYYATAMDKIKRKKSFGLRKERSLIRAITSSTERAMQLVGEPGSGKSVALRHLAKQFAEQGRKSNDKNAIVPLYINLREMEVGNIDEINANSVRDFVLDNIRRGDADTSAFVKENWDDYCDRGLWLFLFDSFDEIPAVLHSAAGSNIVHIYSQAIRQFLEGMGECKGILASREFKGPEALPWKKIRILPLSGEKQDELIRNSFLSEHSMDLVRQHLANSHSSIGTTPLFLTLLCRYVRDEHRAPGNDHDILLQHIDRLTRREPEYLQRKYNLSPEDLMIGAERLARLFAENDTLSLAPTLDQIINELSDEDIPGGSIERLVSALVDCKVGRADVPNAAQGDRRFAFAHRRYQEALFVRYLIHHPETLSATELLTEDRWREYAVTLLQISEIKDVKELLEMASLILIERADNQNYIICGESPLPDDLVYFDWSSEVAIRIISLLQDGLAHRSNDIPDYLSTSVLKFLSPRWERGDSWDRCEVLRLGGLLPEGKLVEYLAEAFEHGTNLEQMNAFRQAAFASELPQEAQSVVLKILFNQVLTSKNRAEQLTLEALAARFPSEMGADVVVSRGKKLRRNLEWIKKLAPRFIVIGHLLIVNRALDYLYESIKNSRALSFDDIKKEYPDFSEELYLSSLFFTLSVLFGGGLISYLREHSNMALAAIILSSTLIILFCVFFSPYLVRFQGKKICISDIFSWSLRFLASTVLRRRLLVSILSGSVLLLASAFFGYSLHWFTRKYIPNHVIKVGEATPILCIVIGGVFIMTITYLFVMVKFTRETVKLKEQSKFNIEQLNAARNMRTSDLSILFSAGGYEQLIFWLKNDDKLLNNINNIRTFSSFVLSVLRREKNDGLYPKEAMPLCLENRNPTFRGGEHSYHFGKLRQILEDRFIEFI